MTVAGDNCLRSGDHTLVFVDGQAELTDVGGEQRLDVRWTTDEGGGSLASVPLEGSPAAPVGYVIEPGQWAEEPSDGCDGPYFLVTGFDVPTD